MVREIGLMDENMQFVFSDVDFSLTARARGWDLAVVPEATCDHFLKSSSDDCVNPVIFEVKIYDQIYFFNKWLNGGIYRSLAFEGPGLKYRDIKKMFYEVGNIYEDAKSALDQLIEKRFSHIVVRGNFDYFKVE